MLINLSIIVSNNSHNLAYYSEYSQDLLINPNIILDLGVMILQTVVLLGTG